MKHLLPLLLLLFVALGCGKIETEKPKTVSNEPPVAVSATDITKAYSENEIAADEKYRNKNLEISGKLTEVSETFGSFQADLEGFKDANGINLISVKCSFDESQKSALSKLKKGSTATFQGTGDGLTAGLYVGLTNCKIKN